MSEQERHEWALSTIRVLLNVESESLARSLEGCLGVEWMPDRGWLEISTRIMWPGPRETLRLSTTRSLAGARHVPDEIDHLQDRLRAQVAAFIQQLRAGPRGRKHYFTQEWWRDATWTFHVCRGSFVDSEDSLDRAYVLRRVRNYLRDAGLRRIARL
jgi:hypothetical protein